MGTEIADSITLVSSTEKRPIISLEKDNVLDPYGRDLIIGVSRILDAKLGKDWVKIHFVASVFQEYMAKPSLEAEPERTIIIEKENFKDTPKLPEGKSVIWIGWSDTSLTPIADYIASGVIEKTHFIYMVLKQELIDNGLAGKYSEACNLINVWMNSERDLGMKFPEIKDVPGVPDQKACDKYHRCVSAIAVDTSNTFDNTNDSCSCGIKTGAVFTVTATKG